MATLAALTYWGLRPWHPYPGSAVLKIVPILTMAWLAWRNRQTVGAALAGALIAHAVGDVLLDLDRDGYFLPAMGGFFVGHLLYIALFMRHGNVGRTTSKQQRLLTMLLVILTVAILVVLLPKLSGVLAVAVPVYVGALVMMAALAIRGRWRNALPVIGAWSFVVSDALIALNTFVQPIGALEWLIWPTYVAAQILIPIGLLQTKIAHQA